MCPNIFSCSAAWFEKLSQEQAKVVVAVWSESGGPKTNEWLERLQKLEAEGTPVFVCDGDSCPSIAQQINAKAGETVVLEHGQEKARLTPGEDLEAELTKVREWTR